MASHHCTTTALLFVVMSVAALTSLLQANMADEEGVTSLILLSSNDTDPRSTEVGVISSLARVFSGPSNLNFASCLCTNVDVQPEAGWCYLGETNNAQQSTLVNVTTVTSHNQTLLRCSLYVTVGKTYLYCNSQVVDGASNCQALLACSSRLFALVCTDYRDCIAWCDVNATDVQLFSSGGEEVEGGSDAPTHVTHPLGHDVIAVIAAGGALGLLVIVCCIVDKIKTSKWWILHCPRKQRKMSSLISEDFVAAVSTFQIPTSQSGHNSTFLDFGPSSEPPKAQIEPNVDRKQSKKNMKVQFRSASLPSALGSSDVSFSRDQHDQRSASYEDSSALNLGSKRSDTKIGVSYNTKL